MTRMRIMEAAGIGIISTGQKAIGQVRILSHHCVSQKSYHSPWYTVRDQHSLKRNGLGLKKRDIPSLETGRRQRA